MDVFTPKKRSQVMRSVSSKNTAPEMTVRRLTHAMGYRYRLHVANLPGKPDLVFPSRRKVIFVHGCFWHQYRCRCGNRTPKTRRAYWVRKLAGNKTRDRKHRRQLNREGWRVLVLWECQLQDAAHLAQRIATFLDAPKEGGRVQKQSRVVACNYQ